MSGLRSKALRFCRVPWQPGRQGTGYFKWQVVSRFPYLDLYLLKYPQGSNIPEHTDPVSDRNHYRLNVVLKNAKCGGKFLCSGPYLRLWRAVVFRPDLYPHELTRIEKGTRFVLSLGWTRSRSDGPTGL